MKLIHPKSKIKDDIKACNSWTCRYRKCSSTRGYCLHKPVRQQIPRVFTNQHVDSSNLNLALETLNSTRIVKCVKPAKDRNHHCKTASGETGRWWRQMDGHWSMTWSKTAPKGMKRALSHHNDNDKISQIDRTQLTIKQRRWLTDNLNMWTRTASTNYMWAIGLGLTLIWIHIWAATDR